ncbi:MAG: hypothetical protein JW920_04135 [Deltaproteobacteria bacterium]|nr:hypothetical protein [Deltaproteobacteria bacterium]
MWRIDAQELRGRIPEIGYEYASHIVPKVKSAVNSINQHTDLKVGLEVEKPGRGKAILVFKISGPKQNITQKKIELISKEQTFEKEQTPEKESAPEIAISEDVWNDYKEILNQMFSLYHLTFVKLAVADHWMDKWKSTNNNDKQALNKIHDSLVWKDITSQIEKQINTMNQAKKKELEAKSIRLLNGLAHEPKIIKLIAFMLSAVKNTSA